jgi:O-antigen/teichoic acid export membrane protein
VYKNLFFYLGLNGVVLLLGFALLPLISNVITPEEYGKVGIFLAIVAFVQPIIGMSSVALVQVKKYLLSLEDFQRFLTNIYIVTFLGFIIIEITLQLYYFIDSEIPRVILIIIPLICLSRFLINIRLMEFTIEGAPFKFGLSRIAVKFWTLSSLLFFYLTDYSIESLPYILILLLSEVFVVVFLLQKHFKLIFKIEYLCKKNIKEILVFGVPVALATIPLWLVNEYGKFLLKDVSLEEVGILTFAKQLSMVYVLVCVSVSNAFASKVLSISNVKSLRKYFGLSLLIYVLLLIVYLYIYELLSPFVIGDKYIGVSLLFKIFLIGCFIQVTTSIPSQLISREGKPVMLLLSAVLASVAFLFACFFVFSKISATNIAFSYITGMSVYALSMWLFTYVGIIKNEFSN